MYNELILHQKSSTTKRWIPIGRLKFENGYYIFCYTKGIKSFKGFKPFEKMNDLDKVYRSKELFPIFQNRLLQKSRPEYKNYMDWLDIKGNALNPMVELALTGGLRATDSLELIPMPHEQDGYYRVKFFSHGIRHVAPSCLQRIESLNKEEKLYILKDIQNIYDCDALALRTKEPSELVGYCPSSYLKDFNKLIKYNGSSMVEVKVVKTNKTAPSQLKLLCEFTTKWYDGFVPFSDDEYQPIA